MSPAVAGWLADALLLLHAAVVALVVGGLLAVVLGNGLGLGWTWVNRRGFRVLHGAAIAVVVLESWAGVECPLTTLEAWLRVQAGGLLDIAATRSGFIERHVRRWIFYSAPPWVFTLAYSSFGALVVAAWWRWPSVPRLLSPSVRSMLPPRLRQWLTPRRARPMADSDR